MILNGKLIQDARTAKKIGRANLSRQVGVDVKTIYNAEKGRNVQAHTLAKIALALEIPLDDLFTQPEKVA
jgi:transcriptional regulator with XRE-family HTH domain